MVNKKQNTVAKLVLTIVHYYNFLYGGKAATPRDKALICESPNVLREFKNLQGKLRVNQDLKDAEERGLKLMEEQNWLGEFQQAKEDRRYHFERTRPNPDFVIWFDDMAGGRWYKYKNDTQADVKK